MLSSTFAQPSPSPNSGHGSTPPAVAPAQPDASTGNKMEKSNPAANASETQNADTKNGNAGTKAHVVASQNPDQWLASTFKGTDVMGEGNKKIGAVSDILFDKSGKIEAYVVSVGGFLGVGAKEVAIAPDSFEVTAGTNGKQAELKLTMTQEELKQAPTFAAYQPPKPTARSVGGGAAGGLGHGSPMAPKPQ